MTTKLPTDMIGARIKAAREAKRWSQGDLSDSLLVSVQAISQWETGRTLPSLDNIMAAANLLGVHPGSLLWGEGFLSEAVASQNYWPRVPVIWWNAVRDFDVNADPDDGAWREAIKGKISGYITPTSRRMSGEFALQVTDSSMAPDLRQGDHLLFEFPRLGLRPGDYVLAVVPPDSTDAGSHAILRKLQIKKEGKKEVHRLIPLNDDFPTIELRGPKDGYIIGIAVEQRRYHRTVQQLFGISEDELDQQERILADPGWASSNT